MIGVVGRGAVATYLFADVDMTWAEDLRTRLVQQGRKITVTAILLKAIGIAQRSHPASRTARLPWGRTVVFHNIVAGFTVERFVGSQQAVFFGAIEAPDTKPLVEIAGELRAYSEDEFSQNVHLNQQHSFSGMPWIWRRLILFLGLSYPWIRLRYLGATFGVSSPASWA